MEKNNPDLYVGTYLLVVDIVQKIFYLFLVYVDADRSLIIIWKK